MKQAAFIAKLVTFLAAPLFLEQCAAQPKVFYVELVDITDDLEIASLNYAINKANGNTSNQGNNPFTLKIANDSQHKDLYQRAAALLQQDVVALIDGHHSSDSACVLSMFTEIPLIRLHGNRDHWSQCEHVGVTLSANYESYARATVQLLETFHWSEVVILYEESFTQEAHYYDTIIDREKTKVHHLKLYKQRNEAANDAVTRTMKRLNTLNARVVLLFAEELYQRKLLSEGRCNPAEYYVWIFQGEIPFNLTAQPNDMIVGFRLPREKTQTSANYEASLQSRASGGKTDLLSLKDRVVLGYEAGQVLSQALTDMSNEKGWVQVINGTPQYAPISNRISLLKHLKKVRLQGITGSIQFDKNGLRPSTQLDLMNLQNNSPVKVGLWISGKLTLTQDLSNDQGNNQGAHKLEGKRLRIVTVEAAPYVMKIANAKTNGTKYEGYCIEILDRLASELKFTYEIGPSPDGAYGVKIEGVWNGMIGDLIRNKTDMAVAALTVNSEREGVVDFTAAHMTIQTDMILKKDFVQETDFLQFMMPFKIPVWIMVLVCLLVVTLCIFTLNYFSPHGYKNEDGKGTSTEFNLFNSFWFASACMLQQGGDNTPRSVSGRILTGCFWFCILVWVSTYTANLVAFFAVKNERLPINNLQDALESDYDIGVLESSSDHDFFRNSKSDFHQKVFRHMESRKTYAKTNAEAFERVRKGKYIYVTDSPYLTYMAGKKPCDLITLPALTIEDSFGFALQANNPHVKEITLAMLRMRQEGFFEAMHRKWWEGANECSRSAGIVTGKKRIALRSLTGVYIVLAVGLFLSFVVLGAEIMWFNRGTEKAKGISGSDQDNQDDDSPYDLPVVSQ